MSFGMSFRPVLVSLVCEGARLARLGEDKIFKSKFQILIPLIDFIAVKKLSFSSKLPRFSKNSISRQVWLKIQTPLFSKWFLGFFHLFEWKLIQLLLDFNENLVLNKIGWKTELLRIRNDFWVLFISLNGFQLNLTNLHNPWYLRSRSISSSRGDRRNPEPEAQKT